MDWIWMWPGLNSPAWVPLWQPQFHSSSLRVHFLETYHLSLSLLQLWGCGHHSPDLHQWHVSAPPFIVQVEQLLLPPHKWFSSWFQVDVVRGNWQVKAALCSCYEKDPTLNDVVNGVGSPYWAITETLFLKTPSSLPTVNVVGTWVLICGGTPLPSEPEQERVLSPEKTAFDFNNAPILPKTFPVPLL